MTMTPESKAEYDAIFSRCECHLGHDAAIDEAERLSHIKQLVRDAVHAELAIHEKSMHFMIWNLLKEFLGNPPKKNG